MYLWRQHSTRNALIHRRPCAEQVRQSFSYLEKKPVFTSLFCEARKWVRLLNVWSANTSVLLQRLICDDARCWRVVMTSSLVASTRSCVLTGRRGDIWCGESSRHDERKMKQRQMKSKQSLKIIWKPWLLAPCWVTEGWDEVDVLKKYSLKIQRFEIFDFFSYTCRHVSSKRFDYLVWKLFPTSYELQDIKRAFNFHWKRKHFFKCSTPAFHLIRECASYVETFPFIVWN